MALKQQVVDRLLLSKSLLDRIRFQPIAVHDRHAVATNIITAHDAAELAIAAIADELDCLPANRAKTFLMDYFDPIEKKNGASPHGRDYLRQLNDVRNLLKHQGLYPDGRQWSRVAESVYQDVAKWCLDYLNIAFGELDESALLSDPEVKKLYDDAKQAATDGNYKQALEKIAVALSLVFENNAALRGLTVGNARSDEVIRLSGFGVHANDFLALQQFLPRVASYGEKQGVSEWKQSGFGHPGNWREDTVNFCLGAFLDVAIKIQDARWIPGALPRSVLYDQEIEALKDNVEIWTEVRKNNKGEVLSGFDLFTPGEVHREVILVLNRGTKLRASVSVAEESSGNSAKDAFFGGGIKTGRLLRVMGFSEEQKLNIYGNVLASDVKVSCVPRNDDFIRSYFPNLEALDWDPE
jgi:hypothetical protein